MLTSIFRHPLIRPLILCIADCIVISASYLSAQWIRLDVLHTDQSAFSELTTTTLFWLLGIRILCGLLVKQYTWSFKHSSMPEAASLFKSVLVGSILFFVLFHIGKITTPTPPRSIYPMEFCFTLMGFTAIRFGPRYLYQTYIRHSQRRVYGDDDMERTLILGAGHEGVMILRDLLLTTVYSYKIIGFVDDAPSKWNSSIHGHRVIGTTEDLPALIDKHRIDRLLIADPAITGARLRHIVDICSSFHVRYKVVPPYADLVKENPATPITLKDVELEDLLDRKPVRFEHEKMAAFFAGKTALVTGAAGSIGSEICRQVVRQGVGKLIALDVNENDLYFLHLDLKELSSDCEYRLEIRTVREADTIEGVFARHKPDIVFHAAAHKHVPLMEYCPVEALKNNVQGTINVAEAAKKHKAESFVLISTDKAVRPTNVMGASKALAEMVIRDLNDSSPDTMFMAVRFGNVLGSNGSLVPILNRQIKHGGPITITHPNITRFFMTIPEAVGLVLVAAVQHEGATCVLDMGEPVSIDKLARSLIALSGLIPDKDIEITYTGLRPGEKMYEELFTDVEALSPSTHPRIRLAQCKKAPERVSALRSELDAVITDGSKEAVVSLCRTYVDGFEQS